MSLHDQTGKSQDFFSHKNGVPKGFAIFTGKHLCWSLFLMKRLLKQAATLLFSDEYCKTFNNTFFEKTSANGCFCL